MSLCVRCLCCPHVQIIYITYTSLILGVNTPHCVYVGDRCVRPRRHIESPCVSGARDLRAGRAFWVTGAAGDWSTGEVAVPAQTPCSPAARGTRGGLGADRGLRCLP